MSHPNREILVAWLGDSDLQAASGRSRVGLGPIAQAVQVRAIRQVEILSDKTRARAEPYARWLRDLTSADVEIRDVALESPTDYAQIYLSSVGEVEKILDERADAESTLTFHLSAGTPASTAIMLLLAKTHYPSKLIQSSLEQGVQDVDVPFDIARGFLPELLRKPDEDLLRLAQGLSGEAAELDATKHRSAAMKRVVSQARRVALRNVPVLIQGEAGTEKEPFARAIHGANLFRKGPFIAVKCAAIPDEWVESELFGATIGQQRRATDQAGYVAAADGGTLFLDDVDELPLEAQVKLFRVLQEKQVTSIGSTTPRAVNVRVITATARDLRDEVLTRRFSEDLFYSIAVAVLTLPPLRERGEDMGLLIDAILLKVNREAQADPAGEQKRLSAGAKKLLVHHNWPGNVRELENAVRRMAVWSADAVIDVGDVEEAISSPRVPEGETILGRPLGKGLSLPGILSEVARHYLERAMEESQGTKTRAAELVGLPNHQTLTNWLAKYGVEAER